MADSAGEVVQSFLQSINSLQFDRAAEYLAADEFSYRSPISTHESGAGFLEDLSRLGSILKRVDVERMLCNEHEASILMTIQTHIPDLARTRIALWASVSGGLIQRMEMVYDASAYQSLFDAV